MSTYLEIDISTIGSGFVYGQVSDNKVVVHEESESQGVSKSLKEPTQKSINALNTKVSRTRKTPFPSSKQ